MNAYVKAHPIYHDIYSDLVGLVPEILGMNAWDVRKSSINSNFRHLSLFVECKEENYMIVCLTHYYKDKNGDVLRESTIRIRLFLDVCSAEALDYESFFSSVKVYFTENHLCPVTRTKLNSFLNATLKSFIDQCPFGKPV